MLRSLTESNTILPSAVEPYVFEGRRLYIKRDDLIDEDLSGNKFRKLYALINTPASHYKRIISYGGSQSNAMASIAALCKRKGWVFVYITKQLSHTLKTRPMGNLALALADGMQLIEVDQEEYRDIINSLYAPEYDGRIKRLEGDLVLAQGGADIGAKEGIAVLAKEILSFKAEQKIKKLCVVTPSGTGTTALYLAKYLPEDMVLSTPLIGDRAYLLKQMSALEAIPPNLKIIECEGRYHFGKPYLEFLAPYNTLLDQGIEMDLLYAPKTLLMLKKHLDEIEDEILYVHSGGVKGNRSMLERYERKKSDAQKRDKIL